MRLKKPSRKNHYIVVSASDRFITKGTTWTYHEGSPNWYNPSAVRFEGQTKASLLETIALEKIQELGILFPENKDGRIASVCFRYNPGTFELVLSISKSKNVLQQK